MTNETNGIESALSGNLADSFPLTSLAPLTHPVARKQLLLFSVAIFSPERQFLTSIWFTSGPIRSKSLLHCSSNYSWQKLRELDRIFLITVCSICNQSMWLLIMLSFICD